MHLHHVETSDMTRISYHCAISRHSSEIQELHHAADVVRSGRHLRVIIMPSLRSQCIHAPHIYSYAIKWSVCIRNAFPPCIRVSRVIASAGVMTKSTPPSAVTLPTVAPSVSKSLPMTSIPRLAARSPRLTDSSVRWSVVQSDDMTARGYPPCWRSV